MARKYLLVTECDLDRCSKMESFDDLETAKKERQDFINFCIAFPCGYSKAYIAEVLNGEVVRQYE